DHGRAQSYVRQLITTIQREKRPLKGIGSNSGPFFAPVPSFIFECANYDRTLCPAACRPIRSIAPRPLDY
ncbi:MAG: hypothetical protein ACXWML_11180, partial [Candidatus Binataceae bacterium]